MSLLRSTMLAFCAVFALTVTASAQRTLTAEVRAAVRVGVVQILAVSDQIPRRTAAGFRWQADDLIVTAFHVVAGANNILVSSTMNGVEASKAEIIAVNMAADLALLRTERTLPGEPLPHRIASGRPGEALWVVGYPLETPGLRSRQLIVSDIAPPLLVDGVDPIARAEIEVLGFPALNEEVIQLEGSLLPGDSGAPIIDADGFVVAIGSGGLRNGQVGLGWGIPAGHLDDLLTNTDPFPELAVSTLKTLQAMFFSQALSSGELHISRTFKVDWTERGFDISIEMLNDTSAAIRIEDHITCAALVSYEFGEDEMPRQQFRMAQDRVIEGLDPDELVIENAFPDGWYVGGTQAYIAEGNRFLLGGAKRQVQFSYVGNSDSEDSEDDVPTFEKFIGCRLVAEVGSQERVYRIIPRYDDFF